MEEKKTFYSTAELANLLGVSRVAIFNKIKSGKIEAEKIGRNYIIPASAVLNTLHNVKLEELSEEGRVEIQKAVEKVIEEYGQTLKLLGKE